VNSAGTTIYVADNSNNMIRAVSSGGVVSTLAGQLTGGFNNATGTAAQFSSPAGVAVNSAGTTIYVADYGNNMIRAITTGGVVSTFAGQIVNGHGNATGTSASFYNPNGVAVDSSGNVYVADSSNNLIRKITTGGVVSTLAGQLTGGSTNATGTAASFNHPTGVAVDGSGNVYVADEGNNMIREITSGGVVSTLAGQLTSGHNNATGTAASFFDPWGVAVDAYGNVYVAELGNSLIRFITPAGVVSTLAGSGSPTFGNGTGTGASFNEPTGVAVYSQGGALDVAYVADEYNFMIREIH